MGRAVARRLGSGRTVVLADYDEATLTAATESLGFEGHHVQAHRVDVTSADSVGALAAAAAALGPVAHVVHTAGLSPSQAPTEAVLAVDLLGTALVLDAFGAVVAPGGAGVVIASMAGHMFPPVSAEQEQALAHTPAAELLGLPFIAAIDNPGLAYGIAKQANQIRVRAASKTWGARGARVNAVSPGIISTPMSNVELASPMGDGMRAMIAGSGTGRIGTPDDIAAAVAFLLGPDASFITGVDLLVDGGVVAAVRSNTL